MKKIEKHRTCEPRRGSEAIFAQIASDSECQAGRLTERHGTGEMAKLGTVDIEIVWVTEA